MDLADWFVTRVEGRYYVGKAKNGSHVLEPVFELIAEIVETPAGPMPMHAVQPPCWLPSIRRLDVPESAPMWAVVDLSNGEQGSIRRAFEMFAKVSDAVRQTSLGLARVQPRVTLK